MSNPGEWIDFNELCNRLPGYSRTTLNRRVADRSISSRQLCTGGKRQFNFKTVQRELVALEKRGIHAEAAERRSEMTQREFRAKFDELNALVHAMAEKLGVAPFAGEQRKAG